MPSTKIATWLCFSNRTESTVFVLKRSCETLTCKLQRKQNFECITAVELQTRTNKQTTFKFKRQIYEELIKFKTSTVEKIFCNSIFFFTAALTSLINFFARLQLHFAQRIALTFLLVLLLLTIKKTFCLLQHKKKDDRFVFTLSTKVASFPLNSIWPHHQLINLQ